MIKPTIGRVVHVRRHGIDNDQPEVGFITYVHSDRCINLAGFDRDGVPFSSTSVPLVQEGDDRPTETAYAEWMPYQKGQAAQTEAIEAAMRAASDKRAGKQQGQEGGAQQQAKKAEENERAASTTHAAK